MDLSRGIFLLMIDGCRPAVKSRKFDKLDKDKRVECTTRTEAYLFVFGDVVAVIYI
jgi:hypothetical protein